MACGTDPVSRIKSDLAAPARHVHHVFADLRIAEADRRLVGRAKLLAPKGCVKRRSAIPTVPLDTALQLRFQSGQRHLDRNRSL